MAYGRWYVVLVSFPFTDLSTTKRRPAVIVACPSKEDLILAAISSNPGRVEDGGVLVPATDSDFNITGLSVTSIILPSKLFTLSHSLIEKKLGILPVKWQLEVKEQLRIVLSL